jgi:hypothetical protein
LANSDDYAAYNPKAPITKNPMSELLESDVNGMTKFNKAKN